MRVTGFARTPFRRRDGACGKPRRLGILAFEVAGTMSRLISLHFALTEEEIARLCSCMRSQGVVYLNSNQLSILLRLACAEMVNELDCAAAEVARHCRRCHAAWPHGFQRVYEGIKAGTEDKSIQGLVFKASEFKKKVKKMERYVGTTSELYTAMKDLTQLEAGERQRAEKWTKLDCPKKDDSSTGAIRDLINLQQNRVNQLHDQSLWSRDISKICDLMARSVLSLLAKISSVFGDFVMELPPVAVCTGGRVEFQPCRHGGSKHTHRPNSAGGTFLSGPLEMSVKEKHTLVRNSGHNVYGAESWKSQALEPPRCSLGASGLALRYARVVIYLEHIAKSPELVDEMVREKLYWMLPLGIRSAVKKKLRGFQKLDEGGDPLGALASGWKEAAEAILEWLVPMARDTERWQAERSFEQRTLGASQKVMMLQTLMFADKVKFEAAIVEVLVAFSFVCRYTRGGKEEDGER